MKLFIRFIEFCLTVHTWGLWYLFRRIVIGPYKDDEEPIIVLPVAVVVVNAEDIQSLEELKKQLEQ